MLGDGSTIIPSSRTISVASGEGGAVRTRVISSSRLLSDGGGESVDLVQQAMPAATTRSGSRGKRVATDSESQHGSIRTAGVKAEPVPPHKRPRRTKSGAGSVIVGAA